MSKSKWKKPTILLCPVCGTELHILNQRKVKCLCLNRFEVLGTGRDKRLVPVEDVPAVKKAMQVKCKDCLDFFPARNSKVLGDCLSISGMRRNIDGNCIRICKKFKRK